MCFELNLHMAINFGSDRITRRLHIYNILRAYEIFVIINSIISKIT